MNLEGLARHRWFPGGLARELSSPTERLPPFWRLGDLVTDFGALKLALPEVDERQPAFWTRLAGALGDSGNLGNLDAWGELPTDLLEDVVEVEPLGDSTNVVVRLGGPSGTVVAKSVRLLAGGRERRMALAGLEGLAVTALAGISWGDQDLLLFYCDLGAVETAGDRVWDSLGRGDPAALTAAVEVVTAVGRLLGRFHRRCLDLDADPELGSGPREPDPAAWNTRMKRLARSAGVAPLDLPPSGPALTTHGDFHLGQVVFSGEPRLMDLGGEPLGPLTGCAGPFPAVRDLACCLRSLDYLLSGLPGGILLDPGSTRAEVEPALRQALIEGWRATAPAELTEGMGTGAGAGAGADLEATLHAWEYERALYELFYERAFRRGLEAIPRRWLAANRP